ncbi:hypothetical protein TNIN_368251 [Trichonephila inaurata madagascariensis]|uniref:Uncharacterized protein n=1 Tax=Trichonephila inaurata madagascariensis TaxID=2747483 RepID=A0A8X6IW75_9ARAC|nr:hypothetical protein TNIN_368251 [Trichonephila inaurata madagascariensis]
MRILIRNTNFARLLQTHTENMHNCQVQAGNNMFIDYFHDKRLKDIDWLGRDVVPVYYPEFQGRVECKFPFCLDVPPFRRLTADVNVEVA